MDLKEFLAPIAVAVPVIGLLLASDYFIHNAINRRMDTAVEVIMEELRRGDAAVHERIGRNEQRGKEELDRVWSEMKGE